MPKAKSKTTARATSTTRTTAARKTPATRTTATRATKATTTRASKTTTTRTTTTRTTAKAAKGPMSKTDLIQTLVDSVPAELTKKDVKAVIDTFAAIGQKELKKTGLFVVPGLVRMSVTKKPATKARKGINPFTGEPAVFKAKPARKVIKARPVKAAKDAL